MAELNVIFISTQFSVLPLRFLLISTPLSVHFGSALCLFLLRSLFISAPLNEQRND